MTTMRARLIQVPEAEHKIVLSPPEAPMLKGAGSLNIVCGGCGTTLIQNGQPHLTLRSTVIRCPKCKQCNELNLI